ncbi:MAG: hypothetical protein EA401_02665 [Planctomycetota bacterium]|nr:MAG: hypothetical protein EA401_02665 [Planctomycetota bacterium]
MSTPNNDKAHLPDREEAPYEISQEELDAEAQDGIAMLDAWTQGRPRKAIPDDIRAGFEQGRLARKHER